MDDRQLLSRLRERLQETARVPALPAAWSHESAMLAAHGVSYGGDFIIGEVAPDGASLQLVLVDVCGSGDAAVPSALQFAGALRSLIRSVPESELLDAANDFLLRQRSDESMATALHLWLDLATGDYRLRSAGHPPALRRTQGEWVVDSARGTALGVQDGADYATSAGRLAVGEALLFYTDGVVESRNADIDEGITWLQQLAGTEVAAGWEGLAGRIVDQVDRGDDDRAVLVLRRTPQVEYS